MRPLISVIVPVYNGERVLGRCLEHLTRQTYENLELLLVNDGSTDGSLALMRSWAAKDARIRVIDKPNGGVSECRNVGLDSAKGEYIGFCDCDDYPDDTMYEELYGCAVREGADLVFCEFRNFDECGNVSDVDEGPALRALCGARDLSAFYTCTQKQPVIGYVWRSLYAKKLVSSLRFLPGLARGGVAVGEDFIFVMEAALRAEKMAFVDRPLYFYFLPGDIAERSVRYVRNENFAFCFRNFCREQQRILREAGLHVLAAALDFYTYQMVTGQYVIFRKDYRRQLKALLREDAFYENARSKACWEDYRVVYHPRGVIENARLFLLRHKQFGLYALFRKIVHLIRPGSGMAS